MLLARAAPVRPTLDFEFSGEVPTAGLEKIYNGSDNALARPYGLRENAENAVFCRGPGPARKKKKRYTGNRMEEEDAQICPCGKAIE